jgi:ParB-like chromosome segregation protein Spo0J
MADGTVFPPIRVWFDGTHYWLSDGFQRLAAARLLGRHSILAVILAGELEEARWDSFGANAAHGCRYTRAERQTVICRALTHANARDLSNNQLAKYLGVPEPTLRRWRKRLFPSVKITGSRVATRKGRTYMMRTVSIGANNKAQLLKAKTLRQLREEAEGMKASASDSARRVLNIVSLWAFGTCRPADCLEAIEKVLRPYEGYEADEPRITMRPSA